MLADPALSDSVPLLSHLTGAEFQKKAMKHVRDILLKKKKNKSALASVEDDLLKKSSQLSQVHGFYPSGCL